MISSQVVSWSYEPKMFKLVPRSHLAQSFVSTFLCYGMILAKKSKRKKNWDRLKFSHRMHQCQTDRFTNNLPCEYVEKTKTNNTHLWMNVQYTLGQNHFLKSRSNFLCRFTNVFLKRFKFMNKSSQKKTREITGG